MKISGTSFILNCLAFISGAVTMTLELVGSRILAPYVGASVFVWTSLIGLILVSLGIGYSLGGKIADKNPSPERLSKILLLSGICIAWTLYSQHFLPFFVFGFLDIRVGSILACAILFAPATIYLGMISPFLMKLKVNSLATTGKTAGRLGTLSAAGSIAGTFLGGYILVSYFTTETIVFSLSFVMLLSVLTLPAPKRRYLLTGVIILVHLILFLFIRTHLVLAAYYPDVVTDVDTPYGRYWIYDQPDAKGDMDRYITNNYKIVQSGISLKTGEAVSDFVRAYDSFFTYAAPQAKKALLIGAAGYTYPKLFAERHPDKTLDIVEIDPALQGLAEKYFEYVPGPGTLFSEDGRMFLAHTTTTYDAMFIDAFSSYGSVPVQMSTKEAIQLMSDHLSDNGVLLVNILCRVTGDGAAFLKAEYATYKSVFPYVYIVPVQNNVDPSNLQDVTLIAGKSKTSSLYENEIEKSPLFSSMIHPDSSFAGIPLTDAFAPVEKYTAALLKN